MIVLPRARVFHPDHGAGTVVTPLFGGRARVRFDRAPTLPRSVPVAALVPLVNGAQKPEPSRAARVGPRASTTEERAARPPDWADLWQTIEALRLGVVPFAHARDYTVGRRAEVARLEELLRLGQGMSIVRGDYGVGKTHLLDVLEQMARAGGFVTSRVTLDPREVALSHPLRLYRAVLNGLRFPDGTAGSLDPIFERLEASGDHVKERAGGPYSRFLSPALFVRRTGDADLIDLLADYVEGYPMDMDEVHQRLTTSGWHGDRLLALSDFRTYGRMYAHLLGTLASWAKDAGFKGLLVLFDEMERADVFDAFHLDFAVQVIAHYAAVTLPREALRFDPETLYRGGHRVHRRLPLRFREDQPLSVVLALTPAPRAGALVEGLLDTSRVVLDINALDTQSYAELVDRVASLYVRAYPEFSLEPNGGERLRKVVMASAPRDGVVPREMVRATVTLLDLLRHGRIRNLRSA
jgi:hypothetical protein